MLNKMIADNVRDFILRFGQDFMFISPNYRVQAGDEEKFIDLLFLTDSLTALWLWS